MSESDEKAENGSTEEITESKSTEEVEEEAPEEVEEETVEEEKTEAKRETEEDIVAERIYTVPLGRAWLSPRKDRAPKAMRILKKFMERHMKPESIVINEEVNERIWGRGIEKPPRKIRVRAIKDSDGKVSIHLAEGN